MTDERPHELPFDGPSFVKRLMPSAIVAMGGTELVAYLQPGGARKVKPGLRETLVDSMLDSADAPSLSRQGKAKFRSAMLRMVNDPTSDHVAWGSLPVVRATVTLSLWQTALELATGLAAEILCKHETGVDCGHEPRGFAGKWKHFIGALSRLDGEVAEELCVLFRAADPVIKLRHRLVHDWGSGQDGLYLERSDPKTLNQPVSQLRDGLMQAVLRVAFRDDTPEATMHQAHFQMFGLPQDLLDEVQGPRLEESSP